ncbi:hypothetical protein BH23BAC1_BH23BAC1_21980 [soil metagenome]
MKKLPKSFHLFYHVAIPLIFLMFLKMSCTSRENNSNNIQYFKTGADENENSIKAKPALEWAEMLKSNSGWIGADGIYAVALNGVETHGKADSIESFFWFSDSIIGEIENDILKDDWEMVHNSVAYMVRKTPDPSNIKFYWSKDEQGQAKSVFEPNTPQTDPEDYYWLGDGVYNHAMDSTIYIFAYRIRNVPGQVFPFKDVGVSLIALPKGSRPPFSNQRQMDTPLFLNDNTGRGKIVFGASVLPNTIGSGALDPDGYIYVYGLRGRQKELLVARVKDYAFEDFSQWRYWDGQEWNIDVHRSAALTSRVSNEMSVSFMEDGRVIAAYQLDTNSPNVVVQVGDTPAGPFYPFKKVWETPEIYEDLDFYTYNAKAFPHLSEPGELLISYNVNAFNFLEKLHKHPHHLRPRFITVKYN